MAILFRHSARRHGIGAEIARPVVEHCLCPLYAAAGGPDSEDVVLFIGPDANGVPLEVFGFELRHGDLLVIHAMRLRRRYGSASANVMRCR